MHQSYISEAQSLDESKGPVPTLEEIGLKPVDEGKGKPSVEYKVSVV